MTLQLPQCTSVGMDAMGFFVWQFALLGFAEISGRLIIDNSKSTWVDAHDSCNQNHGCNLAVTEAGVAELEAELSATGTEFAWVGLVLVYGVHLWVDGTAASAAKLPASTERRMCLQYERAIRNYTLHDCATATASYVCDTGIPRSPGFTLYNTPELSFAEAVDACNTTGMQLMKDDSYAKHLQMKIFLTTIKNLESSSSINVWIGVKSSPSSLEEWFWHDDVAIETTYWGINDPNADSAPQCARLLHENDLSYTFEWADTSCSNAYPYLCEALEPNPTTATTAPSTPSEQLGCGLGPTGSPPISESLLIPVVATVQHARRQNDCDQTLISNVNLTSALLVPRNTKCVFPYGNVQKTMQISFSVVNDATLPGDILIVSLGGAFLACDEPYVTVYYDLQSSHPILDKRQCATHISSSNTCVFYCDGISECTPELSVTVLMRMPPWDTSNPSEVQWCTANFDKPEVMVDQGKT